MLDGAFKNTVQKKSDDDDESTLVISTSVILHNRLSRKENLILVLT